MRGVFRNSIGLLMTVRRFPAAPWPRSLKVSSAVGTMLLVGVSVAAYRAVPVPTGFTHYFGAVIAIVPAVILILSILFMVTGYAVSSSELTIQRPLWATEIPLSCLQRVSLDPAICNKSVRIFGNGGLYGFTGLYQNSRLGRYRLFATDIARSVVLRFPDRTVVITPAAPDAFVEHMRRAFPFVREG